MALPSPFQFLAAARQGCIFFSADDLSNAKPIPEENSVTVAAVVAVVLVNRVSDASPPATVKKTLVIIALFGLHFVLVINGSRAFTIGTSKGLHHQVLEAAGCDVPRSAAVWRLDGDRMRFREVVAGAVCNLLEDGCAWPPSCRSRTAAAAARESRPLRSLRSSACTRTRSARCRTDPPHRCRRPRKVFL